MTIRSFIGAAALALVAACSQAQASTQLVDFTVSAGGPSWTHWNNYWGGEPFGVVASPRIAGSALLDNTKTDGTAFLSLDWVTGTKTWTLADIDVGATTVDWDASGNFIQWGLIFTSPSNYVYTNNTVQINEGGINATYCNGCVRLGTSYNVGVPEPGAWALMLIGVGAVGAALRSRRRALGATATAAA